MSERICPCQEYKEASDLRELMSCIADCDLFPSDVDLEAEPETAPACWQSPLLDQGIGRTNTPKEETGGIKAGHLAPSPRRGPSL